MKCFITRCNTASSSWNFITKKSEKCEKRLKSPAIGEEASKSFKRDEKLPKTTAQLLSRMSMRYRKRSMFKPSSEKMLKVWQRVIPDQNKELKMNHVLCELHFKNEDIERDRVVYKKGGIVEREVRKCPILNEEAVPCYFSKNLSPRLRPRGDEGCAVQFELPVNFSEELVKACDKLVIKKLIKETGIKPFFEELTKHVTKCCIPKMLADDPSCSFSHITEDCSVWCWWNVHTTCLLKKLLIFKTGKVQIFLQEKEIHIPGCRTVNSLEECLKLVDKVSNVEACVKLDFITGSTRCPGYVENDDWDSKKSGPKRRRCSFCIKYCNRNKTFSI